MLTFFFSRRFRLIMLFGGVAIGTIEASLIYGIFMALKLPAILTAILTAIAWILSCALSYVVLSLICFVFGALLPLFLTVLTIVYVDWL